MSILQKLTEGVQSRDMQAEGAALLNKWEATGLLEGLNNGSQKQGMAVLLENQAKELLREASSMAAGDVEGFAAVAFPIVRRVFGGLIANDLVSVQPMSLPSGLIFFLDFTHNSSRLGAEASTGLADNPGSIYGGNVVGRQLTGGVNLSPAGGGHYDLGNSYSSTTGSVTGVTNAAAASAGGLLLDAAAATGDFGSTTAVLVSALSDAQKKVLDFDPDILANPTHSVLVVEPLVVGAGAASTLTGLDEGRLQAVAIRTDASGTPTIFDESNGGGAAEVAFDSTVHQVRRLTKIIGEGATRRIRFVLVNTDGTEIGPGAAAIVFNDTSQTGDRLSVNFPVRDTIGVGLAQGSILAGAHPLEEPSPGTGNRTTNGDGKNSIAEIDIKVDSIAVTAQTKKLKAKWSPELGQDLNAYHNLDAEVELTGILSEQIALEIDRELLDELVRGATAGTRYWSRAPGLFVDSSGNPLGATSAAPDFTGTVSEWYETLIETINEISAQIHRKTLRGGANFVVCSPEVANILEFTSGFRASVTADQDRGTIGAIRAGSLSKKFDVYVDPYFMRNVLLVGRKGSSFLESGFVYAPYVPLQVTPTIFGTEDFVPRKGVMTRYAKKMVRPDMYGLVICRGLLGESGL